MNDIEMKSVEEEEQENEELVQRERQERSGNAERQIQIHPLVLFNIADHFTRQKKTFQLEQTSFPQVIGALFGIQNGLQVDVYDSFEMKYAIQNGLVEVDKEFLNARIQQFSQVFPGFELLGWYTVGSKAQPSDLQIHRTVMEFNESPLFLLLSDDRNLEAKKKIPVSLFESELHVLNGTPKMLFVKTPFKMDTSETEGIAMDHVSKSTPAGEANKSSLHQYLGSMKDAVSMLSRQSDVLIQFLQATQCGKIPMDHSICRQIYSICNELPALSSSAFDSSFMQEHNDTLLVTYLAALTKGTHTANTVIERFANVQERQHPRGNLLP